MAKSWAKQIDKLADRIITLEDDIHLPMDNCRFGNNGGTLTFIAYFLTAVAYTYSCRDTSVKIDH